MTATMPERPTAGRKVRAVDAPIPDAERLEPEWVRPEFRTALCCECGEVRTVRATAPRRGGIPEAAATGERCTERLKCAACERVTKHAALREDPHRNYAEEQDAKVTEKIRDLIAKFADAGFTIHSQSRDEAGTCGDSRTSVVWMYQFLDTRDWVLEICWEAPFALQAEKLAHAWKKYKASDNETQWFIRGADDPDDESLVREAAWGADW